MGLLVFSGFCTSAFLCDINVQQFKRNKDIKIIIFNANPHRFLIIRA